MTDAVPTRPQLLGSAVLVVSVVSSAVQSLRAGAETPHDDDVDDEDDDALLILEAEPDSTQGGDVCQHTGTEKNASAGMLVHPEYEYGGCVHLKDTITCHCGCGM